MDEQRTIDNPAGNLKLPSPHPGDHDLDGAAGPLPANPAGEIVEVKGTRADHLEWCKARAREYLDMGQPNEAFVSMASDLSKHPETETHIAIALGMQLMMIGQLSTEAEMRKFIEGFN